MNSRWASPAHEKKLEILRSQKLKGKSERPNWPKWAGKRSERRIESWEKQIWIIHGVRKCGSLAARARCVPRQEFPRVWLTFLSPRRCWRGFCTLQIRPARGNSRKLEKLPRASCKSRTFFSYESCYFRDRFPVSGPGRVRGGTSSNQYGPLISRCGVADIINIRFTRLPSAI